jgi:DNA-binding transcriptional ArsR family regulator
MRATRGTPQDERTRLLTTALLVLVGVDRDPRASYEEIAVAVGVDERSVTRNIRALKEAGYLESTRPDRRNRYVINRNTPLAERGIETTVGDLLGILAQ